MSKLVNITRPWIRLTPKPAYHRSHDSGKPSWSCSCSPMTPSSSALAGRTRAYGGTARELHLTGFQPHSSLQLPGKWAGRLIAGVGGGPVLQPQIAPGFQPV